MSVLIVGSDGSMGKRYQAILTYLGVKTTLADKRHTRDEVSHMANQSSGIIIASPTETHVDIVRQLLVFQKPILCEKPVTKNIFELKTLQKEIAFQRTPFRMVMQYEMLTETNRIGRSYYNYFKHGNDGLAWDCMQIIGLARGHVQIEERSPVWSCMINGKTIHLEHMDAAYIGYVQKWIKEPNQDPEKILDIHEKTASFERVGCSVAYN